MSIILFLNKTDLLEEKVGVVNFGDYFPEFEGNSRSLGDVQRFQLSLFDQRRRERELPLFYHFTTAINTENIKVVFDAVRIKILEDNLKVLMLQ